VKEGRVLQRVRKLCLSLPETGEAGAWGHPNFRAGKRTFVTFEWVKGRPSIAFRLSARDVGLLLRRQGFFATPYGQGKWVSVWADLSLNWGLVERLLERSYRTVAIKRMIAALAKMKEGADRGDDVSVRDCLWRVGRGRLLAGRRVTKHFLQ